MIKLVDNIKTNNAIKLGLHNPCICFLPYQKNHQNLKSKTNQNKNQTKLQQNTPQKCQNPNQLCNKTLRKTLPEKRWLIKLQLANWKLLEECLPSHHLSKPRCTVHPTYFYDLKKNIWYSQIFAIKAGIKSCDTSSQADSVGNVHARKGNW